MLTSYLQQFIQTKIKLYRLEKINSGQYVNDRNVE